MVGFALTARDPKDGRRWIVRLMVDKAHHRKGYGRRAMELVLDRFGRIDGCTEAWVSFVPGNDHAMKLYESLGFRPTGAVIDGELVYRLDLAQRIRLEPLDASRRDDFLAVMRAGSDESPACLCTAYHQRGYDQPGAGAACRDRFFAENRFDGFLLYVDGRAMGWCQAGPWGSFAVLAPRPPAAPGAWAVTCMVLARDAKRRGLSHVFFGRVLDAIRQRGATYAVAFGHRLGPTYSSPLAELPESVCIRAGMTMIENDPECPVYGRRL